MLLVYFAAAAPPFKYDTKVKKRETKKKELKGFVPHFGVFLVRISVVDHHSARACNMMMNNNSKISKSRQVCRDGSSTHMRLHVFYICRVF